MRAPSVQSIDPARIGNLLKSRARSEITPRAGTFAKENHSRPTPCTLHPAPCTLKQTKSQFPLSLAISLSSFLSFSLSLDPEGGADRTFSNMAQTRRSGQGQSLTTGCEASVISPTHAARANMAHMRRSRPDDGPRFQAQGRKTFQVVASSLTSRVTLPLRPPLTFGDNSSHRTWHSQDSQGHFLGLTKANVLATFQVVPSSLTPRVTLPPTVSSLLPASGRCTSEYGTHKTVKARFRPCLLVQALKTF